MFDDYDELSHLKETAAFLAEFDDWLDLYNGKQLARNEVPVYSSTYVDDMYLHFDLSRKTVSKIKNCKHFITNVVYISRCTEGKGRRFDEIFVCFDGQCY